MAVAYASQGAATLNLSSSVSLAKPSGLAAGDLMVAMLEVSSSGAPTVLGPSGWAIAGASVWSSSSQWFCGAAFKIADASDVAASSFAFTATGGAIAGMNGAVLRFTGADTTSPINGVATTQTTTSGTTGALPGMTTTVADCLVVQFATYNYAATPNGSQWPNAAPSGSTLVGAASNSGLSIGYAGAAFTQASAGATGGKSVALNGARSASQDFQAYTIAIAPAATAGSQSLAPARFDNASTLYAAVATPGVATTAPALLSNLSTLFAPTLAPGASLGAPLLANTNAVYAASVAAGLVTLSPGLLSAGAVLFAAAVTPGGVTLAPGRLDNVSALHAATVTLLSGDRTLLAARLENLSLVHAPTIPGGAQAMGAGLLSNLSFVLRPALTQADRPGVYPLAVTTHPFVVRRRLDGGGAVVAGAIPSHPRVIVTPLRGRP